jgi:hypothetical protein
MRGLDPRIHQKKAFIRQAMDCRVKPGHDERRHRNTKLTLSAVGGPWLVSARSLLRRFARQFSRRI